MFGVRLQLLSNAHFVIIKKVRNSDLLDFAAQVMNFPDNCLDLVEMLRPLCVRNSRLFNVAKSASE